jgi:hypothetical protein
MVLEIFIDAPNGEKDRERIFKLFEDDGYFVRKMELQVFPKSQENYFKVTVEENDTFKQD